MVMVVELMKNASGTLGCKFMITLEVIGCCKEMMMVTLLCGFTTLTELGVATSSGSAFTKRGAEDPFALQLHTADTVTTQAPAPIHFKSNEKLAE